MNRARYAFAAMLAMCATTLAQTPPPAQAPPMQSILAGKKLTPPIRGQAEIDYTKPVTKRVKDMVITTLQVKNTSSAPIPRLTVDETWFDKNNNMIPGGKTFINGLLQPGEIKTVEIQTPYNAKMNANSWTFSHANGTIKPHRVDKFPEAGKEPATKTAAATKNAATKKK